MRIVLTWLRLEMRRHWRSLAVLALLVAVATATVLTAAAGARRGHSAADRLWDQTLPGTVTVLPNQPGFDWAKIRALPEVAALTEFPVVFGFALPCCPEASTGFPTVDGQMGTTIERPVMLSGRMYNPERIDEIVVTPQFEAVYHKHVGDTLTLDLASIAQVNQDGGYDGTSGPPAGPKVTATIVGVGRSFWGSVNVDGPNQHGGVLASPALFAKYEKNIMGTNGDSYINALIRLKGGPAEIPAFRADLARVTGRSDIDMWDNQSYFGGPIQRLTEYEAACLLAFGLAALLAALFLIGGYVARYISARMADLQVLQAVGLTPRQAVASAAVPPFLAAAAGATLGVAGAIVASRWMPIGEAAYVEPHPGIDADWLILGPGWVLAPLLVGVGIGGFRGARAGGEQATERPAPVQRCGGRGRGRAAGLDRGGHPVRARVRAGAGRGAGPAGAARCGGRRAGRAGCVHLLGRGGRRDRQPGPLRPDLAAGHVLRPVRPGFRARRQGPAGGGRRSGRHRHRRCADRRGAVRPGLGRELHLRPGRRQADPGRAHRWPDARCAGRDRAGAGDGQGPACRHGQHDLGWRAARPPRCRSG